MQHLKKSSAVLLSTMLGLAHRFQHGQSLSQIFVILFQGNKLSLLYGQKTLTLHHLIFYAPQLIE